MRKIFCEFEISTYNTLCSRGPTKVLALSRINVPGSHPEIQNEAKNISRQDFMVMNISCKFEKASYNIFLLERKQSITRGSLAKTRCTAKTKHPKKDIKVSAGVLRKCSASSLILLWQAKSA